MTLRMPAGPSRAWASRPLRKVPNTSAVEVLICGSPDRGDDGAPIAAAALLRGRLDRRASVRTVGQLDIDDLLAISPGAAVVIVDAAVGLHAGQVVTLPITGLIGRTDGLRPRSSHALSFPEVVGLAELLRGRPVPGRIVAIGGSQFGLGKGLSRSVAIALPRFVDAILEAIDVASDPRQAA